MKTGFRRHQLDGSEYDEAVLQQQLCANLTIALKDGFCMEHAKETLIKHLIDEINGFCREDRGGIGVDDTPH